MYHSICIIRYVSLYHPHVSFYMYHSICIIISSSCIILYVYIIIYYLHIYIYIYQIFIWPQRRCAATGATSSSNPAALPQWGTYGGGQNCPSGAWGPGAAEMINGLAAWFGYGSIPINTIFRGMNIHLPAILMFTRGTRFWHTAIYSPVI